jgi:hypothetical protein
MSCAPMISGSRIVHHAQGYLNATAVDPAYFLLL